MADDTPPNPPQSLGDELENAAEQGGTPEPEVVETDSLADEVHNAQQQGGTPTPSAREPKAPAAERRAARQSARDVAAGAGKPKTIEEREAARLARRRSNAAQRRAYRARLKTKRAEQRAAAPPAEAPAPAEHGPGRPKVRQGIVVSDKADKTITLRVDEARRHRRYRKIMRTSATFHAHDEANDAHVGDTVRIVESRPLSRLKRWRLVDVLERAR